MKKLLTTLTALAMLTAALPATAHAENPDLKTLASSLGADTDFFSYSYVRENPTHLITSETQDYSAGIAELEMLIHNGNVSLKNDILGYESTMNKVNNIKAVQEAIKKYADNSDTNLLCSYLFKKCSTKERISEIIEMTENAEKEGKYILLRYRGVKSDSIPITSLFPNHTTVGIGIADGEWTFNGKTYDKCILTLDSANLIKLNIDGSENLSIDEISDIEVSENDKAFSEETCIYINSETSEYLIPKYNASDENGLEILSVDENLLFSKDISDLYKIRTKQQAYMDYTVTTEKDGIKTIRNKDNNFLDYCHDSYNGIWVVKADKIRIDCELQRDYNNFELFSNSDVVGIEIDSSDSVFEYENGLYRIYNDKQSEIKRLDVGFTDSEEGKYKWSFGGTNISDISFKSVENGLILECKGNNYIEYFDNDSENLNNDNYSDYRSEKFDGFYLDGKIMLSFDNDDIPHFLSDIDNDGVFEHEIEKGDVNCDGKIDASDASYILKAYADMSVGINRTINHRLADFNGDNKIDAADASDVLTEYARRATN